MERLDTMRAVHVHASGNAPEDEAYKKLMDWVERKGLSKKGNRLFGRNTYPTMNPEPHSYEFFLTIGEDVKPDGDVDISGIPGGLYAVLRLKNLDRIGEAWQKLWKWIDKSKHEHVGWKKGEYGWINGFEELLTWQENKPTDEWIFDLWVQLKEDPSSSIEQKPSKLAIGASAKHETRR